MAYRGLPPGGKYRDTLADKEKQEPELQEPDDRYLPLSGVAVACVELKASPFLSQSQNARAQRLRMRLLEER